MLDIAIISALIAFVYAVVLVQPGEILSGWSSFIFGATWNEHTEKNHWIYKVLLGCEKCIAGQICLWWFLRRNFYSYSIDKVIIHIFTICLGIFLTIIIKKIYNECQK